MQTNTPESVCTDNDAFIVILSDGQQHLTMGPITSHL